MIPSVYRNICGLPQKGRARGYSRQRSLLERSKSLSDATSAEAKRLNDLWRQYESKPSFLNSENAPDLLVFAASLYSRRYFGFEPQDRRERFCYLGDNSKTRDSCLVSAFKIFFKLEAPDRDAAHVLLYLRTRLGLCEDTAAITKTLATATGSKLDIVGHNYLLEAFSRNLAHESIIVWLQKMERVYKVKPDLRSFGMLVQCLVKLGLMEHAQRIVEDLPGTHFIQPNSTVYSHLIRGYVNSGDFQSASLLFQTDPEPDSLTSLLACPVADFSDAFSLFRTWQKTNSAITNNTPVYSALMELCASKGKYDLVLALFREATQLALEVTEDMYALFYEAIQSLNKDLDKAQLLGVCELELGKVFDTTFLQSVIKRLGSKERYADIEELLNTVLVSAPKLIDCSLLNCALQSAIKNKDFFFKFYKLFETTGIAPNIETACMSVPHAVLQNKDISMVLAEALDSSAVYAVCSNLWRSKRHSETVQHLWTFFEQDWQGSKLSTELLELVSSVFSHKKLKRESQTFNLGLSVISSIGQRLKSDRAFSTASIRKHIDAIVSGCSEMAASNLQNSLTLVSALTASHRLFSKSLLRSCLKMLIQQRHLYGDHSDVEIPSNRRIQAFYDIYNTETSARTNAFVFCVAAIRVAQIDSGDKSAFATYIGKVMRLLKSKVGIKSPELYKELKHFQMQTNRKRSLQNVVLSDLVFTSPVLNDAEAVQRALTSVHKYSEAYHPTFCRIYLSKQACATLLDTENPSIRKFRHILQQSATQSSSAPPLNTVVKSDTMSVHLQTLGYCLHKILYNCRLEKQERRRWIVLLLDLISDRLEAALQMPVLTFAVFDAEEGAFEIEKCFEKLQEHIKTKLVEESDPELARFSKLIVEYVEKRNQARKLSNQLKKFVFIE